MIRADPQGLRAGRGEKARTPMNAPRTAIDSGWLYMLSGMILVAAVMLIAPADDLARMRYQHELIRAEEEAAQARLASYARLLAAVEERDPDVMRRLFATQLRVVPSGTVPVLLPGESPAEMLDASIDSWVEATTPPKRHVPPPVFRDSWLRRMSAGNGRLWLAGFGLLLVFVGLLPTAEAEERPATT